jgi:hypothetical protein
MRRLAALVLGLLLSGVAVAQSDRGTITGTVSDPAGAVVASAAVEARNQATGALYTGASSGTGNYTLTQLPAGTYDLSVSSAGFKRYVRTGITVEVAGLGPALAAARPGSASKGMDPQPSRRKSPVRKPMTLACQPAPK